MQFHVFVQATAGFLVVNAVHGVCRLAGENRVAQDVDGDGRFQILILSTLGEVHQVHLRPIVKGAAFHVFLVYNLDFHINLRAVLGDAENVQTSEFVVIIERDNFAVLVNALLWGSNWIIP